MMWGEMQEAMSSRVSGRGCGGSLRSGKVMD